MGRPNGRALPVNRCSLRSESDRALPCSEMTRRAMRGRLRLPWCGGSTAQQSRDLGGPPSFGAARCKNALRVQASGYGVQAGRPALPQRLDDRHDVACPRRGVGAPGCGRRLQALLGRPHAAVASQLLAARLGGGQRLLHAPRDEAARHPVADLPVAGQVVCDPPQEPRACRRRLSSGRGRARRASRPALALTERRNAGDDRRCGTRRAGLRGAWVCWIFAVWVTCWAFPLTGG